MPSHKDRDLRNDVRTIIPPSRIRIPWNSSHSPRQWLPWALKRQWYRVAKSLTLWTASRWHQASLIIETNLRSTNRLSNSCLALDLWMWYTRQLAIRQTVDSMIKLAGNKWKSNTWSKISSVNGNPALAGLVTMSQGSIRVNSRLAKLETKQKLSTDYWRVMWRADNNFRASSMKKELLLKNES